MPSSDPNFETVDRLWRELREQWRELPGAEMPDAADPLAGLLLRWGEHEIALRWTVGRELMAELVGVIHQDVATLPRDALEVLLELNFLASADGSWVALEPETRAVLLLVRRPVDGLLPSDLSLLVSSMAALMEQWGRDGGFLHAVRHGHRI